MENTAITRIIYNVCSSSDILLERGIAVEANDRMTSNILFGNYFVNHTLQTCGQNYFQN